MSNLTLPAELLDHIVDHLDTICALRSCCLVSKSWIPRARRHLFAKIKFDTRQKLHSWKRTFPDPLTSPACYANTLSIDCFRAVTATDAEAGFSLAVKSLRVDLFTVPSSRVFDLILSLPLLEDLTVVGYEISVSGSPGGLPTAVQPSNPPTFTGSLEIDITTTGVKSIVCRLLSLPGGIHFRRLTLKYIHNEDLPLTTMMVERCFHTLEFLSLACDPSVKSAPIDLSKATKLKDVDFRLKTLAVEWIVATFQATVPKDRELRQISIRLPHHLTTDVDTVKRSSAYGQWLDLDRLLVQFWESRSTPPKVICTALGEKRIMRGFVECCLPELTKRGMIDLDEGHVS